MDVLFVNEKDYMKAKSDGINKHLLDDTKESEDKWNSLLNSFKEKFKGYSCGTDYDFADWHHGVFSLSAYLYNEKFYSHSFLSGVNELLVEHDNCFAEFECFNPDDDLIGFLLVYKGIAYFDTEDFPDDLKKIFSG